jgi:hypothetical protein
MMLEEICSSLGHWDIHEPQSSFGSWEIVAVGEAAPCGATRLAAPAGLLCAAHEDFLLSYDTLYHKRCHKMIYIDVTEMK